MNTQKTYVKKSKEERQLELSKTLQLLEKGVQDVFTSDRYLQYLKFYSRMHNYSFNNTILILSQFPEASFVASYATFKSMHINVKKGSKALKVLVPIPYKKEILKTNKDNPEESELIEINKIYFRLGNVFDISMTDGSVPSLVTELTDNPKELEKAISMLMQNNSIPTEFDENLVGTSTNGYYHITDDKICIKPNMSLLQTFKTLIHEKAHSILHRKDCEKYSRNECEVQAESIAFCTCEALGLDTSDYSFGYVASWSQGKELRELQNSLSIIEKTTKEILKWVTENSSLSIPDNRLAA